MKTLQEAGVGAGVVQDVEDQFLRDEQYEARGFLARLKEPEAGDIASEGIPVRHSVTPGRIRVHGPRDYIETLESIPTDKISLAGKKEDFTAKQIPVSVSNPKATVLNTVVDVQFRIGEKRVERSFTAPITGVKALLSEAKAN